MPNRSLQWTFRIATLAGALLVVTCGTGGERATDSVGASATVVATPAATRTAKPVSTLPDLIRQVVEEVTTAVDAGSTDVSGLSSSVLHVSSSGSIELVFHAVAQTGPSEEADLEALGATIVSSLKLPPALDLPPVGMTQAWIPYDRVEAAAVLPWVSTVTPPSYGVLD